MPSIRETLAQCRIFHWDWHFPVQCCIHPQKVSDGWLVCSCICGIPKDCPQEDTGTLSQCLHPMWVFAVTPRRWCVLFCFQWGTNHPLLMLSFPKFPIPWPWPARYFHLLNSTVRQLQGLGFLEQRPPILMHLHSPPSKPSNHWNRLPNCWDGLFLTTHFSCTSSRYSPLRKFTRASSKDWANPWNLHAWILGINSANLMKPNPQFLQLEYKMACTWWKVKPLLDWISNQ